LPSSKVDHRPCGIAAAAAAVLILSLPVLFREPATTIRSAELYTELVSRLADSSEGSSGWTAAGLDSLVSLVAPGLVRLPPVSTGDLVAGSGSIYPSRFVYVFDPSASSMLIAASATGTLVQADSTTESGRYRFTFSGDGGVTLFLLTGGADRGWPGTAYDLLSASF
jgi:hypothetical protein